MMVGRSGIKGTLSEAYARFFRERFDDAAWYFTGAGSPLTARRLDSLHGRTRHEALFRSVPARTPLVAVDPLPVLDVCVNGGLPLTLMIGAGGGGVSVDRAAARAVGIREFRRESGVLAGGSRGEQGHRTMDTRELEDLPIRSVSASTMSTEWFSPFFGGCRADGDIGTVPLFRFLSRLDYPVGELLLWPRNETHARALAEGDRPAVDVCLAGDHFTLVRGRVNGHDLLLLGDRGPAGKSLTCPMSTVEQTVSILYASVPRRSSCPAARSPPPSHWPNSRSGR
ncbi:hypothetical protein [Streptomyces liliifuscus]|uniref:Uncharacterized protein n=1 Tax=Streptomyces liliifuscus TaxID=2797636 RepID=A0A7T7RGW8_9ACTN|nr:hypothetical protein [Streptomyces liliifuscus]QQM46273.1 hypothetical protein JEQ17_47260 [Streptomyces liliifuscus]